MRGLALALLMAAPVTADNEWSHHGADLQATKFVDLTQIHADNFDSLRIVWR